MLAHTFCMYSVNSGRSLIRSAWASATGIPVPWATGGRPSRSAYLPSAQTVGRRFWITKRTTLSSVRTRCQISKAMVLAFGCPPGTAWSCSGVRSATALSSERWSCVIPAWMNSAAVSMSAPSVWAGPF